MQHRMEEERKLMEQVLQVRDEVRSGIHQMKTLIEEERKLMDHGMNRCVLQNLRTMMDEMRSEPHQNLFHPNNKFNGKIDAATYFAREHYSIEMQKRTRTTQELLFEIFLRIGSG